MTAEKHAFQAEVGKLLDIVANSLYSQKEVFLRELISNASDACDRLRYAALTQPDLLADDPNLKIRITPDAKAKTLTIADNGIGMTREELVENLGTIARSGTAAFVEHMADGADGTDSADLSLIGQFGVGFYSAFMVAEKVEVTSRKAGDTAIWRWESDGKGEYTIEQAEARLSGADGRGTDIRLHLGKAHKEFLEPARLRQVVKAHSDHIAQPIVLENGGDTETLNEATALWTRPKSEISEQQYTEFYHHVSQGFDEPWLTLHFKAEGRIEYTGLLFVPSTPPFDLFAPDRRRHLKLYVRRVFITDDCAELIPAYLRFVTGIVDSEDLSLNISREMLQHDPMLAKIRAAVVKRVLNELKKNADKDAEAYGDFWRRFGAVLKEGLYEADANRDTLLALARFHNTETEGLVSLADYVGRMKDGQRAIYYMTGEDVQAMRGSPQIEGFKARGVEVLLMADPVDEFWLPTVGDFDDKPFKSVTRGSADLDEIAGASTDEKPNDGDSSLDALVAMLKLELGDTVKDVRLSKRLTDSAVCLVADEGDLDIHLERLLKQHRQVDMTSKRILELNGGHALIKRLAELVSGGDLKGEVKARFADAALLLLDQARIAEGDTLDDPAAFARRMATVMERSLGAA